MDNIFRETPLSTFTGCASTPKGHKAYTTEAPNAGSASLRIRLMAVEDAQCSIASVTVSDVQQVAA
jgi:phage-related minor tail protein